MKCESCGVLVRPEFTFAISSNQCPACGSQIMRSARLAAYLSLKTLLGNTIPEKSVDVDKLASVIMANFEVKQIFQTQEELPKAPKKGIIETEEEVVEEEEDSEPVIDEDGIRYEKVDKKKAKDLLQKMRDEALSEALSDRGDVDFTDEELLLLNDSSARQEQVLEAKRKNARQKIQSGGNAAFSRSS